MPNKQYNSNFFLKIDSKNLFKRLSEKDDEIIIQKIDQYQNSYKSVKGTNTQKILADYFSEISKYGWDIFNTSQYIGKQIYSSFNKKDSIENYINYFFNLRYEITYATSFILNIEGMRNLGRIVSYIYAKLSSEIKDLKTLKSKISESIKKNSNPLTDFYKYCADKGLCLTEYKKTEFWDKKEKNYLVPGELLFIINLFSRLKIIDIDINFQNENFDENDFKLYYILMLNLNIIFNDVDYFKINIIHKKLQEQLYIYYSNKLINDIKKRNPDIIKINNIQENNDIYDKKWNFENNFYLKEFRALEFIKRCKEAQVRLYDDFTVVDIEKPKIFRTSLQKNKDNKNNIKLFFDKMNDTFDDKIPDVFRNENNNTDKIKLQTLFVEKKIKKI